MKIRIRGNSVRYRLTKTEVKTFCETGYYEEKTQFNDRTLTYALKASDTIEHLAAEFSGDTITVHISVKKSEGWTENETVGFQHTTLLDNGEELFLLIEKDFACLDNTTEDQSDNYPNPLAEC